MMRQLRDHILRRPVRQDKRWFPSQLASGSANLQGYLSMGIAQGKRVDKSIRALLTALRQELVKLYGPRFKGLVVFGSYARGQARPGSDLDVAMLLEEMERPWPEIRHTGPIVADLSLKYGITVSLIPVP